MTLETYVSALDWLGRGWTLLPIMSGTKYKGRGFGIHQARLTDPLQVADYFRDSAVHWNLGVVAPDDGFILDFDDWGVYLNWVRYVKSFDERIVQSYTEITPNDGAHVFLCGQIPHGFQPIDGVEVKHDVVVAPSVVEGREYEVLHDRSIYRGSLDACFFSLSRTWFNSLPGWTPSLGVSSVEASTRLDKVKSSLAIYDLMKRYYPKIDLRGGPGSYFVAGRCPFHQAKTPSRSFWINTQKNIFGCHSCKVRGDVINFYALVNHLDNKQAVKDLVMSYAV